MKTVGIALGGGGARGLAHIPMLEVLDDLGIIPAQVSGTSIGAIIGALYASGMSGSEIRAACLDFMRGPELRPRSFFRSEERGVHLRDVIEFDWGRGAGTFVAAPFLEELERYMRTSTFEGLEIPLLVVAADFWNRSEVALGSGAIGPAIAASFALPGVFRPVEIDGAILIDGGVVNPVPYDVLTGCEVRIGIDVTGVKTPKTDDKIPSLFDVLFNSAQVASRTIVREKMRHDPPSVYFDIGMKDVRVLEFHRAQEILDHADQRKGELRALIEAQLAM